MIASALSERFQYKLGTTATLFIVALAPITIQTSPTEEIVQAVLLLACLAIFFAARASLWDIVKGPSARLLLGALVAYTIIGGAVALAKPHWFDDLIWSHEIFRQGYHLVILAAVVAGVRTALRSQPIEHFLAWSVGLLGLGCLLVILTPLAVRLDLLEVVGARSTGTLSDPNDAGLLAVFTISLALSLQGTMAHKGLVRICQVLGITALVFSFSNTGAIVLVATIVVFLLLRPRGMAATSARILLAALLGVVVLFLAWSLSSFDISRLRPSELFGGDSPIVVFVCDSDPGPVLVNIYGIDPDSELPWAAATAPKLRGSSLSTIESAQDRVDLWKRGLDIALDNPLLGSGLRALDPMPFIDGEERAEWVVARNRVHNVYILLVGEAGLAALAIYLAFLFVTARMVVRSKPSAARSVVGVSLVLIVVYGLAFHHLVTNQLFMLIFGFTAAVADHALRPSSNTFEGAGSAAERLPSPSGI